MNALQQARIDLAAALRMAERLGLAEGVCNHFSVKVPGREDRFLVNPFGLHWSEVKAGDLLVVDDQGAVVEGRGKVEKTALMIHAAVQRASRAPRSSRRRSCWRTSPHSFSPAGACVRPATRRQLALSAAPACAARD